MTIDVDERFAQQRRWLPAGNGEAQGPDQGSGPRRARWWDELSPAERSFMTLTGMVRLAIAASVLGVSPAGLRRHLHDGRCSGRKFDGEWFVGRGTVDRWWARARSH